MFIRAGYKGFEVNTITGKGQLSGYFKDPNDLRKGFGGNITFDHLIIRIPFALPVGPCPMATVDTEQAQKIC